MTITPQRLTHESPAPTGGRWRATRWRVSAASIKGSFHAMNQDSFHCKEGQFWGVADGVGGGAHGEVASALLMEFMASLSAPSAQAVQAALQEADQRIGARMHSLGKGPGAAVMACLWAQAKPDEWLAATVGDCKVMHMQRMAGRWQCVWSSPDQTYERAGQQPPPGVSPKSPANMVGCGLSAPALTHTLRLRHGDRLVVCSDGFASQSEHPAVAAKVAQAGRALTPELAGSWCDAARNAGSQDDITVLIVQRQDRLTRLARLCIAAAAAVAAAACVLAWSLA